MALLTQSVLIVDDDPEHLTIYGWLVQRAGFAPVTCLVQPIGPRFDPQVQVDLVLLDYVMHCDLSTEEIARIARATWPGVPLLLLSDIQGMPTEMAPLVRGFVRKGEPEKLLQTLTELLAKPDVQPVVS
jgi:DNA-binding response OmpR family regulator